MVDDEQAEHLAQHEELRRLLAASQEVGLLEEDTDWLAALHAHLVEMHGISEAADPVFLHRHLHPVD
jgi:hypothetical protein